MAVDPGAVGEAYGPGRAVGFQRHHVPGRDQFRPELHRLPAGPLGQLRARHTVGEAEIVLDPGALAGLAARRDRLHQHRTQAFRRSVHGRAESGRAAADHDQVVEVGTRLRGQADALGQLGIGRRDQRVAVRRDDERQGPGVDAGRVQQSGALRRVRRIPPVRHLVAGEELADRRGPRRPPVADDLRLLDRPGVDRAPRLELAVDHRIELLLRRIPRLEQVVVEVDDVDRLDRGAGVRVRGEQDAPRVRIQIHGGLEELQAAHLWHPVVGEQHGDGVATQFHFTQRVERLLAGLGPDDAVVIPVVPAQVARDRAGHSRVVIDGQDRRSGWCGRVSGIGRHRHAISLRDGFPIRLEVPTLWRRTRQATD